MKSTIRRAAFLLLLSSIALFLPILYTVSAETSESVSIASLPSADTPWPHVAVYDHSRNALHVPLTAGWNRIRFPVIPDIVSIDELFNAGPTLGPVWFWDDNRFHAAASFEADIEYYVFSPAYRDPAFYSHSPSRAASLAANTRLVSFALTGQNLDPAYTETGNMFKLTLGVSDDPAVTDSFDLDPQDAPGLPPSPFTTFTGNAYFIAVQGNNVQEMIKDVKPLNQSLTWRLILNFGDETKSGLGGTSSAITISWDESGVNPFNTVLSAPPYSYTTATMYRTDGTPVDLTGNDVPIGNMGSSATSVTFDGTEPLEVRIVLTRANVAPVAVNDSIATLKNTSVLIDVLRNDIDANNDTLTIQTTFTGVDSGALAVVENGKIRYTPATDFLVDDEFQYTISDGNDTATATVTVIVDEIIATRAHATLSKAGSATPDAGLMVNVEVRLTEELRAALGSTNTLEVVETFPVDVTGLNIYKVYEATPGALAITGTDASLISVPASTNGVSTDVPFRIALPLASGKTTIQFTYRLVGHASDFRYSRTISGAVAYQLAGNSRVELDVRDADDLTMTFTLFISVAGIFHSADYQNGGNFSISLVELLRVIAYFNAGGYHSDLGNGLDNFAPGIGAISGGYHSADHVSGSDGRINLQELLRVISYFNAGAYHAELDNDLDGFAPGSAARR